MGYLQSSEYINYGLAPDTTDDWITVASALIETYCRRSSLAVTQYVERLRLTSRAQTAQLTYLPLVAVQPSASPLITTQARFSQPRRGDMTATYYDLQDIWTTFNLPDSWITLDSLTIDWTPDGSLTFPRSFLGLSFNEVAVTYTAGLLTIPDAVKSACALIVKNAQSTSGLNIKSSRADTLQMQYFSDQLVDSTVKTLLRPWVANRLG